MAPDVFIMVIVVFAATFIVIGIKIGAMFRVWRSESDAKTMATAKATWVMRIFNIAAILVFLAAWGFVACGFGAYISAIGMYDRLAEEKLERTKEILESAKVTRLDAGKTSDGHVRLSGSVDVETIEQVQELFRFNFGDSEAREMMRSVKVDK